MTYMQFEELLTGSRWAIVAAVATGNSSPTGIAAAAGTSLANVSQQARLLAAHGYLTAKKARSGKPGKPRVEYGLVEPKAHIVLLREGSATQKTLTLNRKREAVLASFFWKEEDQEYLIAFICRNAEIVHRAEAVAVVESKGNEIHLLVIAKEEDVEEFRKRFSKTTVALKKEKHLICWTHTRKELHEGLARKDHYYTHLLARPEWLFGVGEAR